MVCLLDLIKGNPDHNGAFRRSSVVFAGDYKATGYSGTKSVQEQFIPE